MKTVNWNKWAAIAEILSAIAILVTLLYLAIQTKQNTQAIIVSTAQNVIERESGVISELVEFPGIYESFTKPELTDDELIRLHAFLANLLRVHENYWMLFKLGVVDETTINRYQGSLVPILSFKRTRNWWKNVENAFDPTFSDRINHLLEASAINSRGLPESLRDLFEHEP